MKKLLVLALTALTITGLVGCGSNDKNTESSENNSQIEQQKSSEGEIIIARVTSVVGNQVSVNLTNTKPEDLPEVDGLKLFLEFDLTEEQEDRVKNGEVIQLEDGSTFGASTVDPNFDPEEDPGISNEELAEMIEEGTASYGDGEQNSDPFADISFDAGSKDFTILAGVKIFNINTEKTATISDIKDGSILTIIIDKDTNTVTEITILR